MKSKKDIKELAKEAEKEKQKKIRWYYRQTIRMNKRREELGIPIIILE